MASKKRIFDKYINRLSKDDISKYITSYTDDIKKCVIDYMKKYEVVACSSGHVIDVFTGEKVIDANNLRTDGEYVWTDDEIYYFDKYNLKLNDDFIEYVLKHS